MPTSEELWMLKKVGGIWACGECNVSLGDICPICAGVIKDVSERLKVNQPICGRIAELESDLEAMTHQAKEHLKRWKTARARYLNGADGCCCLFDKDEKQINWCSVHAELRDERDRLRERLETFADFILEECDEWALAHDAARKAKQVLGGDHD